MVDRVNKKQNLTSKDKDGNILVNGEFKVCNTSNHCSGSRCDELCIIRLYEFEHGGMIDG